MRALACPVQDTGKKAALCDALGSGNVLVSD